MERLWEKSACKRPFFGKGEVKMWKYAAAGIAAGIALVLYCCVRAGAREDRRMEELRSRKEEELDELLKELEEMEEDQDE